MANQRRRGAQSKMAKYWAGRQARWEEEMRDAIREGETKRIRKKPLTPRLVPFMPSRMPCRCGVGGDWKVY
jgi:hypothetical protein